MIKGKINIWTVYVLRTDRGSLYTGQTSNLEKRLEQHRVGKGAKYLRSFSYFKLVYTEEVKDLSAALKREAEIKRMPKKVKEKLVEGYHNRDPLLETKGDIIGFYEREFYCFSNFSSFLGGVAGRLWSTSEHAYQASHFLDTAPELAAEIARAKSAHEAFKIAKANAEKSPKNWEEIKVGIMEEIVKNKLEQNPYIRHKLLQTGDRLIVEDSPKDKCWGWGPNRDGRNELGKIWMRLREKIGRKCFGEYNGGVDSEHYHLIKVGGGDGDCRERFLEFKRMRRVERVVAVLGSSGGMDIAKTRNFLVPAFEILARNKNIAVLSGGTVGGIPEMSVRLAKDFGMATMGVYPQAEERHVLLDFLDFAVAVPPPIYGNCAWGSESSVLTSFPDAAVIFGGSWGTMVEVASIMKSNVSRIKHNERVTLMFPVVGSGGVAEYLCSQMTSVPIPRGVITPADSPMSLTKMLEKI